MNRLQIEQDHKSVRQKHFCEKYSVNRKTLYIRMKNHPDKSVADLIYKAASTGKPATLVHNGELTTITKLAAIAKVSYKSMRNCIIRANRDVEQALVLASKARVYIRNSEKKVAVKKYKTLVKRHISTDPFTPLTKEQEQLMQAKAWRDNGATDEQIAFRIKQYRIGV